MHNPSVEQVIAELGGPELRHGRCRAWWRGGNGANISVDDERWFDHVTGRGGGPLQLAEAVLGETEGRRWYQERYGRVRCCPRAARRALPVADDELLRRVVAALADLRKRVATDDAGRVLWSQVDRIARAGGAEWRQLRRRVEVEDRETYEHWVQCAEALDSDARRVTAVVVAMLSEVAA